MITRRHSMNRSKLLILVFITMVACSTDPGDDPIPYQPFPDVVINLNLPAYNNLRSDKGSVYIKDGVRGIILYRLNSNTYYAFERNCSYRPNDACATVDVHSSTLYMVDTCCGSTFDFNGNPTGGPAWRPLRRYSTSLNGSVLTVTNTPVE